MANNTTLNTGTGGDVIATDDIAGVKYQRIKLTDGVEDSTVAATVTAGNALKVDGSAVTQPVSGTVTANIGTGAVTNAGTFAVQETQVIADNAGFTDGTSKVFPVGLIFDEVAGTALTENDVGAPRMDSKRATIGVIEDATTRGQRATVSAAGAVKVDGSAVTQPVSGTVTANLGTAVVTNAGTFAVQDSQKVVDNAGFTDGTTPVQPAGYIFDEVAGTALTENDAGAARIDSKRAQIGVIEDATTRGQRAAVSAANALKVDGSAVTQPVSGTVTANAGSGTFAVSAASLPLPSGASTAAKQPALGTAGVASADVLSVQGVASMTALKVDGSAVTQPVSGTVTANAGTGTLATSLASLPALATGSNLIGRVNVEPETTGGLTVFHLVSAATTNATNIKASAGQVYGWYIYNSNAAARKVAFHNSATAPTAGASIFFAIVIPPSSGANVHFTTGIAFGTGIGITTVTDLTDAGATAVALNDLIINLFYK